MLLFQKQITHYFHLLALFSGYHFYGLRAAAPASLCMVGAGSQHRQWLPCALHSHRSPLEGDRQHDEVFYVVKFQLTYVFNRVLKSCKN